MSLRPVSYALAAAAVVLHLLFNHRFGYYRDELYFIDCARHLAWGYVDQPPLAPLVAWLTAPLGFALWAMRLLPAVLAGVAVLVACAIARELRGGGFAQALTGITVALAPAFLGLGYALSTELLSPAAWTALVYLSMRLIRTRDERLYLPIALIVAVGTYAKYSMVLCALALAAGIALTGSAKLLRSRYLAAGAAFVVVALLPNAMWQIAHGLPILGVLHGDQLNRHALANGVADESANLLLNAGYFVVTQIAYQNPFFAIIWIVGLVAFARGPAEFRFVVVAYALLVAVVVVTIGRGYYIEGFYPALLAAGAAAIERFVALRPRWWSVATLTAASLAGAVFAPLALPVLALPAYMQYERVIGLSRSSADGAYHLINPLYADQLGWKSMTQTVAHAYWSLPRSVRSDTAVFADRYAYVGALNFYGPGFGLPTAISPNNSYYLWGTRGYSGQSVLAVGATDYPLLKRWFASVEQVAVYRNEYRWILEGPLPIYWCTHPRASLAAMWPAFKYYGL